MKGHIAQRGQRSYRVTIELSRGEDGRRRQYQETVRGTKRTAQAHRAEPGGFPSSPIASCRMAPVTATEAFLW